MTVSNAAYLDCLARAWPFYLEFNDQINSQTLFVSVSDLIWPQIMALILENIIVCFLKLLYGGLKLLANLEK
jgi:hypothetical protein